MRIHRSLGARMFREFCAFRISWRRPHFVFSRDASEQSLVTRLRLCLRFVAIAMAFGAFPCSGLAGFSANESVGVGVAAPCGAAGCQYKANTGGAWVDTWPEACGEK